MSIDMNAIWATWRAVPNEEHVKQGKTYPLDKNSTVIEVGGFFGDWSASIEELYNPNLLVFEPVQSFYNALSVRFDGNPKVKVYHAGLSDHSYETKVSVLGDASSSFLSGESMEDIQLLDVKDFDQEIDLININCEGGEYPLLNRMLETGMVNRCKYIQIQFHTFYPDAENLRDSIRERLSQTHEEVYSYPFIWECWRRK
jgi:FkbM family methyltransferase